MPRLERRSIIVWSSDWTETTGQAIVTRRVVECQAHIAWVRASYGRGGVSSVLGLFGAVVRTYCALLIGRARTVYLVCSRSGVGFLRDLPALVTCLLGVRVVVHVHGSDIVDLLSSPPLATLARAFYDRCEIVLPSEHLIAPVKALCRGKVRLCENFVPQASVSEMISELQQPDLLVVWNSNIMASKGFFDVAEAVRLARAEQPNLRFIALGRILPDGEMTTEVAHAALEALCLQDWFSYAGSVTPDVAFRYTAKADVVVFPSRYISECQPLAILQAMCLGRPIVLRDTPSLRATMGDYPGTLLPNPSTADLAGAILGALEPDFRQDLERAAAKARLRFSPERFDREMSAILWGAKSQ